MSTVTFVTLKSKMGRNLLKKIREALEKLYKRCSIIAKGDLVAVKLHFGEWGNLSFVRPQFVGEVVEFVKKKGGKPFLADTNTLYVGMRSCAPDHIATALRNGFGPVETGAPVIIADGLRGHSKKRVSVGGENVKEAVLAGEIADADAMVVVSHFKGHELTGFGGALKNLGMGCAAREGKLFLHSTVSPAVKADLCTGCGRCISVCPADAIVLKEGKARKDDRKCIGCADCIVACQDGAMDIRWNETAPTVMKKIAEYASAVVSGKKDKILYLNFIMQVSPYCDCYGFNDAPIAPDVGVCLSNDPVAIDQASVDLVIRSLGGEDPFRRVHKQIDWEIGVAHAEKMGIGSRAYTLETID
jgi:uncharacterized Fe-S center protein